jgi:hypothetical protein
MKYRIGDIVRFKDNSHSLGLHEITGVYDNKEAYQYSVTNDECYTEHYARHSDLIFVCPVHERQDIDDE